MNSEDLQAVEKHLSEKYFLVDRKVLLTAVVVAGLGTLGGAYLAAKAAVETGAGAEATRTIRKHRETATEAIKQLEVDKTIAAGRLASIESAATKSGEAAERIQRAEERVRSMENELKALVEAIAARSPEVAEALKAYTDTVVDLRMAVGELRRGVTESEGRSVKRFEAIEKAFAAMSEIIRTKQLVINDGAGRDRIALFVDEPNTRFIMFDSNKQLRTEVRADQTGGFIEFWSGPESSGILQFSEGKGVNSIANKR